MLQWFHGDTVCNFKTRGRRACGQHVWAFIGSCDCCQWSPGPSPHTSLPSVIIHLSCLWDALSWISMGSRQLSSESQGPHLPPANPSLSSPNSQVSNLFPPLLFPTSASQPLFLPLWSVSCQGPQCLRDARVGFISCHCPSHLPLCTSPHGFCFLRPQGLCKCCPLYLDICSLTLHLGNWFLPLELISIGICQEEPLITWIRSRPPFYALSRSSQAFPSLHASGLILKHPLWDALAQYGYTPPSRWVVSKTGSTRWVGAEKIKWELLLIFSFIQEYALSLAPVSGTCDALTQPGVRWPHVTRVHKGPGKGGRLSEQWRVSKAEPLHSHTCCAGCSCAPR